MEQKAKSHSAINLKEIFDAPCLRIEEIDLLMKLYSDDPLYTNVYRKDIGNYSEELEKRGYSLGLFLDLGKEELFGKYILEIRK